MKFFSAPSDLDEFVIEDDSENEEFVRKEKKTPSGNTLKHDNKHSKTNNVDDILKDSMEPVINATGVSNQVSFEYQSVPGNPVQLPDAQNPLTEEDGIINDKDIPVQIAEEQTIQTKASDQLQTVQDEKSQENEQVEPDTKPSVLDNQEEPTIDKDMADNTLSIIPPFATDPEKFLNDEQNQPYPPAPSDDSRNEHTKIKIHIHAFCSFNRNILNEQNLTFQLIINQNKSLVLDLIE